MHTPARKETPMHTPDPRTAHPDPAFIRWILAALVISVITVAVVANGAALLGGVAFVRGVMQQPEFVAWTFGGSIELALAVVSGAMFVEAYRLQPTARLRTAVWALSGVSGTFGALFEIMEYLSGHLTFAAALSAAGWRIFAPFLAAGLWELVIHLLCGHRHRAHRAAESRHSMLFKFFRAVEAEGLVNGTWRAPLAAMTARRAGRRIAKHVPPAERDAALATYLASQEYAHGVRVQGAALAAHTNTAMRSDLTTLHSPETIAAPAPAPAQPVHPATAETPQVYTVETPAVQTPATPDDDYTDRAAVAAQLEAEAITATAPGNVVAIATPRANSTSKTATARLAFLRELLEQNPNLTGPIALRHLLDAGYDIHERTAYSDLAAAKAVLSMS
jgi:hypothetical protein